MCDSCGCGDVPDSKQRSDAAKVPYLFRGIPVVSRAPLTRKRVWVVPTSVAHTHLANTC